MARPLLRRSDEALILFESIGGRVLGGSPPALGLVGLEPGDFRRESSRLQQWLAFDRPVAALAFWQGLNALAREGGLHRATGVSIRRRDGHPIPVEVIASRARGGPQPLVILALRPRDGSAPKAAGWVPEADDLASIGAVSDDLFCLIGLDGGFVEVGPGWENALGYAPDELRGQPVARWVGVGALSAAAEALRRQGRRAAAIFESGFVHRNGTIKRLRWRAVLNGGLVLAGARVLEAAGAAGDASGRAKAVFLANVSHEIRTPLAAILSYAELVLDDCRCRPDSEFARTCAERLDVIRRNGEELLGHFNDVLDLSRLESGAAPVESSPCALRPLLDEVLARARARAEPRGLEVTLDAAEPLPETIRTDGARLLYVLRQLMTNAEKFTERGSIRLQVRPVAPPAAGPGPGQGGPPPVGRLVFEVRDTGVGIPPEELNRLFQPFTRAEAARRGAVPGMGVGLAVSRRFVEQMGGRLEARSTPGSGSVFTLSLPCDAFPSPSITASSTPRSPAPRSAPNPAMPRLDAKVLVAEDNPENQKVVNIRLTMMGAAVTLARNGLEALERARAARDAGDPFDLVLMDMQMPVLDGYEATSTLRAEGFRVPVIAMTAFAMPEDRDECLAFGCDAYVSKPVDWLALHDLMTRLLRQSRGDGHPGHAAAG